MVKAILNEKDKCYYCPVCDRRLQMTHTSHDSIALATVITVYAKCKCPGPFGKEWSFKYELIEASNQ
jgi:hypothetical protein